MQVQRTTDTLQVSSSIQTTCQQNGVNFRGLTVEVQNRRVNRLVRWPVEILRRQLLVHIGDDL